MTAPTRVTIPGATEGFNGLLTVTGYGSKTVRVESIRFGTDIYSEQADAATTKAFYPGWLQDSSFSLVLVFKTAAERDAINDWLAEYMRRVTSNRLKQGSMLAQVPVRRFVRRAVPQGTLTYGDDIGNAGRAYRLDLLFVGATDPIAASAASRFRPARVDAKNSAPFYPSSEQKSGAESLDGTIFDESGASSLARVQASLANGSRFDPGANTQYWQGVGGL